MSASSVKDTLRRNAFIVASIAIASTTLVSAPVPVAAQADPPNPAIDIEKEVSVDDGATWADADTGTGPIVIANANDLYYRFTVSNIGDVNLENISVTDTDVAVPTGGIPASLAPGGTFQIVVGPLDAAAGEQASTAAVQANAEGATPLIVPSDDKFGYVFLFENGVVISGSHDSNTVDLDPILNALPGVSGVDLRENTKLDCNDHFGFDSADPDGWSDADKSPNINRPQDADWQLAGYSVAEYDNDGLKDSCSGGDLIPRVIDSDDTHYVGNDIGPVIDIEKLVRINDGPWFDADTPPGPTALAGVDTVSFKFVITNSGSRDLTDVNISSGTHGDSGYTAEFAAAIAALNATIAGPFEVGESYEFVLGPHPAELGTHTVDNAANVTATTLVPECDAYALDAQYNPDLPADRVYKYAFCFILEDGTVIAGVAAPNLVDAPSNVPGTEISTVTPLTTFSIAWHISCSDPYGFEDPNDDAPDGWGEKGAPVQGVDAGPIEKYIILKDGVTDDSCNQNWDSQPVAVSDDDLTHYNGIAPAAIGDRVWTDDNGNGVQDDGENGVDGVTVELLDENGDVIDTTTTAGGGLYLFDELFPGTYSIRFVPPDGQVITLQNVGLSDADSDADPTTGETIQTELDPGEVDLTWDAGLVTPGIVLIKCVGDDNVAPGTVSAPISGASCSTDFGADANDANGADVPVFAPNATATFTYLVENTGSQSFPSADVVLTDDIIGIISGPVAGDDGDGRFEPGEVWVYQVASTVLDLGDPANAGAVVNGCVGNPGGTPERKAYENVGIVTVPGDTDSDPSHYCNPPPSIDIEKLTNGNQADGANDGDVPVIAPGDTVTWTYLVTNTGTVSIPAADVTVTDDIVGVDPVFDPTSDVGADGVLSPGEVWSYTATGVAGDLVTRPVGMTIVNGCTDLPSAGDPERATYENVGTVTIPGDSDSDPSHYCNPPPEIDIEKLTNGNQADGANDVDVPVIAPGDTVTWTYLVTNIGDVSIPAADVTVTDDIVGVDPVFDPASDVGADGVLSPGEVWTYTATGVAGDLVTSPVGMTIVNGCSDLPSAGDPERATYENVGTVTIPGDTDSDPSHYCNPPPEIDIEKLTNGNQADGANDGDVPVIAPGDTVTWTYLVTNTGSVSIPLADVTVTDDIVGVNPVFDPASDVGADGVLSPGEVWTYTATGTAGDLVTRPVGMTIVNGCTDLPSAGDPERATYENVGTVTIPGDTDSDPSHYCNPPPLIDIEKLTNGNQADGANDGDVPVIAPGDIVTWTYLVTNTGTVSIPAADVTVTDDIVGVDPVFDPASDVGTDGVLSPGEVWTYTATGVAGDLGDPANAGAVVNGCLSNPDGTPERNTYENVGTVTIPGDTDSDPSHYCNPPPEIDIEKLTNGNQADGANDGDVPVIAVGDTVTWTYLVTNTGAVSIPLADVTVTDDIVGVNPVFDPASDVGADGVLSPGEVWTYTATGVAGDLVTAPVGMTIVNGCSDLPAAGDPERATYENVGTVTIPGDTDSDPSHYCNPPPEIDIEKLTNGNQADGANDGDVPVIAPGDTVTWTYLVTNTGTVSIPLADVTVTDDIAGVNPVFDPTSDVGTERLLSPGEVWTYTATGVAGDLVTAPVGMTIVNGCSDLPAAGDPERATYENVGTVTIPGDTDSDPSHYCNPPPEIDIEKLTNGNQADGANDGDVPVIAPGDTVTWTYLVTNTGTVSIPLADVTVTDDIAGVNPVFDPTSDVGTERLLSPGEVWTYTATGVAGDLVTAPVGMTIVNGCSDLPAAGDPERATYENVGTVTIPGDTDSDPSHYCNPPPSIDIEKLTNGNQADGANDGDVPVLAPGATVTWTYLVTNTGTVSIPLADVTVTDDIVGVDPVFDPASDVGADGVLSPGEVWTYTATGVAGDLGDPANAGAVVNGCLSNPDGTPERATYENVGTVTIPGDTDSDPSHYCNPPPSIDIEKLTNGNQADGANDGDVPVLAPGATVTWTYLVTNTGTVSIPAADVTVTDDIVGVDPVFDPASDVGADGVLSPGEVWTYTATGVAGDLGDPANAGAVVNGCLSNPDGTPERATYENVGTVTIPGDTDSDPSHYCNPPPSIDIEKLTNGNQADGANDVDVPVIAPGDTVTWTYLVTNIGDVSIPAADVTVTDDIVGVDPVFDPASDVGADGVLSPGEVWTYTATGVAGDLVTSPVGMTIVNGCSDLPSAGDPERATYENVGTVTIPGDTDSDPSHYCNPPPSIDIEKLTNGNQADGANDGDVPVIVPGDIVTWTYLVTNIGAVSIPAADVTVTDDIVGVDPVFDPASDVGADGVLSPGEVWTYTATGVAGDLVTRPVGMTIVNGCSDLPSAGDPERATYENIGTVTIPGDTDSDPSHYCNPPPEIDIEKLTNGNQADGANDGDVPVIAPGDTVTWTYLVTNTGTVSIPLADVTVTDDIVGVDPVFDPASDVGADGVLSPGEVWTYTATGVAGDLVTGPVGMTIVNGCSDLPSAGDPERATYENVGTVTIPGDTDSDPSHYCNPPPEIDIEKLTNGNQADGANDGDVPVIAPGDIVTWTYLVTNTGTVSIPAADVTVTDDIVGVDPVFDPTSDVGTDGVLSPGEVWTYTATGVAGDLGDPANASAVVNGCLSNPDGTPERNTYENVGTVTIPGDTDSDPSHYCNPIPSIDIEKLTNGNQADGANDVDVPVLAPGDTVTWTYLVTNTGTVSIPLVDVTVTDDIVGVDPVFDPTSDVGRVGVLSPGEVWKYTATDVAADLVTAPTGMTIVNGCTDLPSAGDPERATYENVGTVTIPGDTDSDPSHYCNPPPLIDIEKLTNGNQADGANDGDVPVIAPGATVTWTYLVTNTGAVSIPAADVTVTDDIVGVDPVFDPTSDVGTDGVLSPGEVWTYTATGVAGDLVTAPVGMTIVNGCTDLPAAGDPERATYENVGTVTIPGETDSDPSHYCNPPPEIDIEKLTNGNQADGANDGDVPVLAPGAAVTWTYLVTNTGTVSIPLVDVTVTDDIVGVDPVFDPTSDVGTDDVLSPGEVWTYTATGVAGDLGDPANAGAVVNGCLSNPDGTPERNTYENVGTVTIPGDSDSDPSHYCNPIPSIDIEKLTNGNQADGANDGDVPVLAPGDTVTWTYLVTNTGDQLIPLVDVTVTDDIAGVNPVFDPASDVGADSVLSPGEVWTYTATGIAVDLGDPANANAVVNGCTSNPDGTPERNSYENVGTVTIPGDTDSDPSHYCNPTPSIDIEKLTNGNQADSASGVVPVIVPGSTVTWTYLVTNTGDVSIPAADVTVTDDIVGVNPVFDPTSDVGRVGVLSPGEVWKYIATGTAGDLVTRPTGMTIVNGCTNRPSAGDPRRATYENIGTVTIPGDTDSDPSHYCNPTPSIDIEKLTNGNQADSANDGDVPVIAPGATVTWTYLVTNTGTVSIPLADVTVTDNIAGVNPVFDPTSDVGRNSVLSPGEVWTYTAKGTAGDLVTRPTGMTIVNGCTNQPSVGDPRRATYENIATVTIPGDTDSDPSHYCNPAPEADIAIVKTASTGEVSPAGTMTWTLKITNNGPSTAQDLTISDLIPAPLVAIDVSSAKFDCGLASNEVTCEVDTLSTGASGTVSIRVQVPAGVANREICNLARVESSGLFDPNLDNNSSLACTTVVGPSTTIFLPPPDSVPLPATGSNGTNGTLYSAALILLLGIGITLLSRRRGRDQALEI